MSIDGGTGGELEVELVTGDVNWRERFALLPAVGPTFPHFGCGRGSLLGCSHCDHFQRSPVLLDTSPIPKARSPSAPPQA